jgi:hypothetical protein
VRPARRISAWVAILAVPTVATGIDGMNFGHMPELGYPPVLGIIARLRRPPLALAQVRPALTRRLAETAPLVHLSGGAPGSLVGTTSSCP